MVITAVWENPAIQEINRLCARSALLRFSQAGDALRYVRGGPEGRVEYGTDWTLGLSDARSWRFRLLDNPSEDDEAWTSRGFDCGLWDTIALPGAWSLQRGRDGKRFDKPHYTNVQMPFEEMPPRAPAHNPTGLYRRAFSLPESWKGKRIVLHIGSAESVHFAYINGALAGAGKDTRLPSEYDITEYLREGEQTLCIKVVRYSDASYIEDQDQWWFGGIHRDVYLYATERVYIEDIEALPGGIDGGGTGRLALKVTLGGALPRCASTGNSPVRSGENEAPYTIRYSVFACEAEGAALASGAAAFVPNYRLNSNAVICDVEVPAAKWWSDESPALYAVVVEAEYNGDVFYTTALSTGFRTVRIERRELLINEKPLLIKGVNRHEHDEHHGKTLSVAAMKRDIELLKQHNFNAVRTSHYPNDERWYELCDRYGIYIVDEANIEHHCYYMPLSENAAWSYAYLCRVQRMVKRDKNHVSVIVWSLGNESGDGANHRAASAWIRGTDATRPVHYEGAVRPAGGQGDFTLDSLSRGAEITDIIGPMYPSIELITDFAKYREDWRPLIMIEYSHAMGNSNGSLADYWRAIETHHGLQGGFIWDWMDQGIAARDEKGVKYWKYGGDFDDDPSDYDFCLNGLLFPDQTPKPAMAECKQVFAPVRVKPCPEDVYSFVVENKFYFRTLDGIEMRWSLCEDGVTAASGALSLAGIAAREGRAIRLAEAEKIVREKKLFANNSLLYIHFDFCQTRDTAFSKKGFVISRGERVIHECVPALRFNPCIASPAELKEELKNDAEAGLETFAASFKPSLFRVPTENDGLKTYARLRGDPAAEFYHKNKALYPWLDYDLMNITLKNEVTEEKDGARLYHAEIFSGKNAAAGFENKFLGVFQRVITKIGGALVLEISFDLESSLCELPKIGVSAALPASLGTLRWLGLGPQESYSDRDEGVFLGCYERRVEELEVPYIVPQENGNRSGTRRLELCAERGEIRVYGEKPFNFSASRRTLENMMEALHTCSLRDTIKDEGVWTLNIDIAQRGVGSAACGPDTREEYRLRPALYTLKLYITQKGNIQCGF
ncbi:MAG: DUF4981 domain-containing protein [Spirochaetaceae bacterium]|jgi:beta-galactosidase|nr:DUF4981 domain-containing protein [Spirochaetaceae bacterium]